MVLIPRSCFWILGYTFALLCHKAIISHFSALRNVAVLMKDYALQELIFNNFLWKNFFLMQVHATNLSPFQQIWRLNKGRLPLVMYFIQSAVVLCFVIKLGGEWTDHQLSLLEIIACKMNCFFTCFNKMSYSVLSSKLFFHSSLNPDCLKLKQIFLPPVMFCKVALCPKRIRFSRWIYLPVTMTRLP